MESFLIVLVTLLAIFFLWAATLARKFRREKEEESRLEAIRYEQSLEGKIAKYPQTILLNEQLWITCWKCTKLK